MTDIPTTLQTAFIVQQLRESEKKAELVHQVLAVISLCINLCLHSLCSPQFRQRVHFPWTSPEIETTGSTLLSYI